LGHGKPIGYGSVQISVSKDPQKSHLWTICDSLKIGNEPINFRQWSPSEKWAREFVEITNFENCPGYVSYPIGKIDGKPTVYNWFVLNKEMQTHNAMKPKITNVLPKIGSGTLPELPVYKKTRRDKDVSYAPDPEPGNRTRHS